MNSCTPVYGLYFFDLSHSNRLFLPLSSVNVNCTINNISARVSISQVYLHQSDDPSHPTLSARYSFPLPANAAVAGFSLIKQDGTTVVGIVQETQEAKVTYHNAVDEGKLASLMQQDHPDVFTVTVGNILPNESVKVEISYITELSEDEDLDSTRFSLPTFISTRYGFTGPSHSPALASAAPTSAFFTLSASVETASPISQIGSPSHTLNTELGPDPSLPNFSQLSFSNFARVSLTSPSALEKDFILTIKSTGLDSPKCIAEVHPQEGTDSIAMALTMVPRFHVPDLGRQEFVFLVDRSGSMGGWGAAGAGRIQTAKKALIVMLRALPYKNTLFNIVSFGDSNSLLWPNSMPYNQKTLDEATKHVDKMEADMGGTEIRSALDAVCKKRKTDRPTSLFVLTDGDAWDLDATLEVIKTAVSTAPREAYLRVFSLGIGNSASTAMVNGLARVGNGSAQYVNDTESFTGKTARLLKAAKAPLLRNLTLYWGLDGAPGIEEAQGGEEEEKDDGFELLSNTETEQTLAPKKPISLFDTTSTPEPLTTPPTAPPPPKSITLVPPPPIQQSPSVIRALSPANRFYAYAIISPPSWKKGSTSIPKSVTLRGTLDSRDEVELEIPVAISHLAVEPNLPPPVHTLAARKIIQDYLDGSHSLSSDLDPDTLARTTEAQVVRLGKTYNLSSKFTSFVCVDESEVGKEREKVLLTERQELTRSSSIDLCMAPTRSLGGGGQFFRSANKTKSKKAMGGGFGLFGGLVGSSSSSPVQPQAMAFGSPTPPGGSTQSASRLFGQAAPAPQSASSAGGSLFGSPARSFGGNSLFGASAGVERSRGGFSFGAAAPPPQAPPTGFVSPAASYGTLSYVQESSAVMSAPLGSDSDDEDCGAQDVDADLSSVQVSTIPAAPKLSPSARAETSVPQLSNADKLDRIVREQSFDGSFSVDVVRWLEHKVTFDVLVSTLGKNVRANLGDATDKIVATLAAMVYLKRVLTGEKEAWEGTYEKALDFCRDLLVEKGLSPSIVRVEELEEAVGNAL